MSPTSPRLFAPVSQQAQARKWFAISLVVLFLVMLSLTTTILWPTEARYEITTEKLLVSSRKGLTTHNNEVSLARIGEVSQVLARNGKVGFGTESPGYCWGLFHYPALGGQVLMYSNCSEKAVMVRVGGLLAPLILTPPDIDAFIRALQRPTPGVFYAPRVSTGMAFAIIWRVLTFLILGFGLVVMFIIAPKKLQYFVRDGNLVIQTLRTQDAIPLAGARVFRCYPAFGGRLSGFPLPGYIIATYDLDAMASRVFASAKDEGVMVDGNERVFITPKDIDGMLAALVEGGATLYKPELRKR